MPAPHNASTMPARRTASRQPVARSAQATACAMLRYKTAAPARNAASTQASVPASEHSCRVQAGLAVAASRSSTLRRPSRDPAQAE
jgi:hypothetical protein